MDKSGYVYIKGESAYGTVCDDSSQLKVPALTADEIIEEFNYFDAQLIKMDIEGCELQAFAGMRKFFEKNSNAEFIFEANGAHCWRMGYRPADLMKVLEKEGYNLYIISGNNLFKRTSNDFQEFGITDYLATKRDLSDVLRSFSITESTRDDIFERLQNSIRMKIGGYRSYIATELSHAPKEILNDPEMDSVIAVLKNDPLESVREAISWYNKE